MGTMNAIQVLQRRLKLEIPEARITLDRPDNPLGTWWLDVRAGERSATVEWRPNRGFGVSRTEETGYGEGAETVTADLEEAIRVTATILGEKRRRARRDLPLDLRQVRQRRRVSQHQLAERIGLSQATVAKTERGRSQRISTIQKYVAALGGSVEVRAVFPDEEIVLYLAETDHESKNDSGAAKRAVGAPRKN
jgi:DNA-binding XRE family transcriptional regulator